MGKKPDERIAALQEKIAKKQAAVDGYNKTLANTQKTLKRQGKRLKAARSKSRCLKRICLQRRSTKKALGFPTLRRQLKRDCLTVRLPKSRPMYRKKYPKQKTAVVLYVSPFTNTVN